MNILTLFCMVPALGLASSFSPITGQTNRFDDRAVFKDIISTGSNVPLQMNTFGDDDDDRPDREVGGVMLANMTAAAGTSDILMEFNFTETQTGRQYNWRDFLPKGNFIRVLRWMITGSSTYSKLSDEKMQRNLASLARMLILLREYENKFGIPDFGGKKIQRQVLSDITMDLYNSGCPTWVLESVMIRVAEGLTGKEGVRVMLLPNQAFIYYPNSSKEGEPVTDMFRIAPGFYVSRLGAIEQVAVRLASFASNTKSGERLSAASFQMPNKNELVQVEEQQSQYVAQNLQNKTPEADELAEEILDLASNTFGIFFFLNNRKFQLAVNKTDEDDKFWDVQDSTRELFTRLAANEAMKSMQKIYQEEKEVYSPATISLFHILSAGGASAMWFGGSVYDMAVSGLLAVSVAYIGTSKALAFEERILTEVVASMFVGFIAGMLAIAAPHKFCFGSIALAALLNLMQGFKVVYAVIEVMSRNIVAGSARLFEGILFTGLISYSLKFGLDLAFRLSFGANPPAPLDLSHFLVPTHSISQRFYPFLLPLSALAWSGLFQPSHADLSLMAFHGVLAFGLTLAGVPMFVAGMCVTLSAGIISRFTGREALGNTLAGLYALVPGAYLVRSLLDVNRAGFLENVLVTAATIGLGGWTGSILCSPTILGKSSGFQGWPNRSKREQDRKRNQNAMLYF